MLSSFISALRRRSDGDLRRFPIKFRAWLAGPLYHGRCYTWPAGRGPPLASR
jgi:hypothetical protein